MAQNTLGGSDRPVRKGYYQITRTKQGKWIISGPELDGFKIYFCDNPVLVQGDIYDVTYHEKDTPEKSTTIRCHISNSEFGVIELREKIKTITTKDEVISFQYGEKNTVFGGPIPKESELVDVKTSDNSVLITYKAPGMSEAVTMEVNNIISIAAKLDI